MKVGDLVTWRDRMTSLYMSLGRNVVGIVLEIQWTDGMDFRTDDSILVLWPDGEEWIWRQELELINENRRFGKT